MSESSAVLIVVVLSPAVSVLSLLFGFWLGDLLDKRIGGKK